MNKKFLYIVFACALLITISPFIYLKNISVRDVTHIKKIKYSDQLTVMGIIEGENTVPIKLAYPVYIKECFALNDSYVNKGQLLFTLDMERMETAVKSTDFTMYKNNEFSANKDTLMSISRDIYAAESGYIKNISANSGSLILSNEPLCEIVTSDNLGIKLSLSQEDYEKISVGDVIEFSPVIAPARSYYGTISDRTAVIAKESGLTGSKTVVNVFADIDNADEYIISGLDVSGVINKKSEYVNTLPYEFISQDDGGEFVNIFKDGEVIKKYVETGKEMEDWIEIVTDFNPDILFVRGEEVKKGNLLLKYDG